LAGFWGAPSLCSNLKPLFQGVRAPNRQHSLSNQCPPRTRPTPIRFTQCEALEGLHTEAVACGVGFTLFLVEPGNERVAKLPLHEPEVRGSG
jgi:hypothetical protein